jgi:hypothetical protein
VNNLRHLAQLSLERDAARAPRVASETKVETKRGREAVEEMKRSVQAALSGMGGVSGARVVEVEKGKKKKGKK